MTPEQHERTDEHGPILDVDTTDVDRGEPLADRDPTDVDHARLPSWQGLGA